MLENIVELLRQIFAKEWIVVIIGMCGVLLLFTVCLIVGLTAGDFVKNRHAAKMIAGGDIENGMKKLGFFAPAYDKSREISPPETAFDYDKIIGFPYSYSLIKKLPFLMVVGTAFFTSVAAGATIAGAGGFTGYTALMLILVPFVGFILYIAALVIVGKLLKNAGKCFYAMTGLIRDINVRPAGEVIAESDFVPDAITEICTRIENVALSGGADFSVLNRLYNEIIAEREKYPDGEAGQRLTAALDVLNALIDSAL